MSDLHATAAGLIVDVHDGRLLSAIRQLRDLNREHLADLALILAAQASPDRALRPQAHGADHAIATAISGVAAAYGISVSDITGPSRAKDVSRARQIACWAAYESGAATYVAIGKALGRDHTTVMYAVRKVANTPALLAMARVIRDGTKTEGAA